MNTNIISAPSKVSNVTVLAAVFFIIITIDMLFSQSPATYVMGIVGAVVAFFIPEKNFTGLRISLVACIYSAWYLMGLNLFLFIPLSLISLALAFPKAKPLAYYAISSLFFGHLHLTYKLIGSMERGLDILWVSFSSMPAGAIMILLIAFVYAVKVQAAKVNNKDHHFIKKMIKSASSLGLLIGSILGGLLTGVLLSIIEYKFVLLF
jgi:hypothetical protein